MNGLISVVRTWRANHWIRIPWVPSPLTHGWSRESCRYRMASIILPYAPPVAGGLIWQMTMRSLCCSFLLSTLSVPSSLALPIPASSSPGPVNPESSPMAPPIVSAESSPTIAPAALSLESSLPTVSPTPAQPSPIANLSNERPRPSGESQQPTLRAKALELAAAFSNDGYKIRDGFWFSMLPPAGQMALLAVNLFAGNQYWFCVAVASPASHIVLKLYNENGHLVSTQFYEKNSTAALGTEPSHSGKYYLSIQLLDGAPANFCVLYSYK